VRPFRSARRVRGERSSRALLLIEFPLEVAQIGGVWWMQADLFEERKDVVEVSDGVERGGVLGAEGAAYGGEEEGGVDLFEGDAAVVEGRGEAPVFLPGASDGSRGAPVVVEGGADVAVAVHECWSALGVAQGRAVDREGVAVVAEPAQEGIEHGLVPRRLCHSW
jgi:hypothetical protein